MDQRPRHRATGRDGGVWAAVFAANAALSSFGEEGSLYIIHTDAPPLSARMVLLKRKSSYTSRAIASFVQVAQSTNWTNLHPIPLELTAP